MSAKRLLLGEAGRARLLEGSRVLAGVVRPTLGPAGRTVLLERPMFAAPLATRDGVTVAEEIELHDEFANMGAQLVLESAFKTALAAGDGTTTATMLAHAVYGEGARLVAAGHHPIDLKRGIERATGRLVQELARISRPVGGGGEDIARIAAISAHGDTSVGELLARAVEKVGREGLIHLEQGTALETKLEFAEGIELDRGFSSAYFVTDMERLVVRLDDPYLLLCQRKITRVEELVPILEKVKRADRSLLVVGDVQGDALSLLVVNKLEGTLKVCAILPPYLNESRKESLGDLAVKTGGKVVVDAGPGITLDEVTLEDLGQAKKIVVDQETTTIVGAAGRPAEVEARAREIRALYEATNSTLKHQQLNERLRRLIGGAALIRVGGTTDAETRERTARIEDAMFAVRAAIKEGVVVGGGVALLRAAEALAGVEDGLSPGEAAGVAIARRACEVPCRQIAENAGADGSVVVQRIREGSGGYGYNAASGRYEDLVAAGVIDPTMVVRLALQNAVSIATLLLTTEVCMADAPTDPVDFPKSASGWDALSLEPFLSRRRPRRG
jgi:chaperonin GroEL